ncbi:MAG: hypothetical protein ACJAU6_004199 [Alphaproteobacteria bacterium]|jgi:hypothetical protein
MLAQRRDHRNQEPTAFGQPTNFGKLLNVGQKRKGFTPISRTNGRRMNIPSYHVKDGDVVEFCAKSREIPMIFEASESLERAVPEYITADHNKMTATFLRAPGLADVPYATKMEPNLVIEFYSR